MLLLTDDGELAHRLTHPSHGVEKVYLVRARGDLGPEELERLASGVDLDDGRTAPARIEDVRIDGDRVRFRLAIHEGRKRQVRRMVKAVGGRVTVLTRVSFAGIVLGDLPEGGYRVLKPHEVRSLRRGVEWAPPVGTAARGSGVTARGEKGENPTTAFHGSFANLPRHRRGGRAPPRSPERARRTRHGSGRGEADGGNGLLAPPARRTWCASSRTNSGPFPDASIRPV